MHFVSLIDFKINHFAAELAYGFIVFHLLTDILIPMGITKTRLFDHKLFDVFKDEFPGYFYEIASHATWE